MDYMCNTPVLMIFFNRPDSFAKVFERVRQAKPKTLILAQDGPRNDQDKIGIEQCRKIVENIDWDCNIIRDYSEVNLGCGVRPMSAINLALKEFERVIILEDDCIPSPTFFRYCDELLEKYKDDERIGYISGLNHFETWDCGNSDYFFSTAAAIWGWATWRRAWSTHYDYYAGRVNDEYILKLYKQQIGNEYIYEDRVASLMKANLSTQSGEKLSYWDTQWGFAQFTQNMLAIVPSKNQICNVGAGANSTHAKNVTAKKYIKYRNMLFMPIYEYKFPLKHPNFCVCDREYHNLVYKCSSGNKLKQILRKIKRKFVE